MNRKMGFRTFTGGTSITDTDGVTFLLLADLPPSRDLLSIRESGCEGSPDCVMSIAAHVNGSQSPAMVLHLGADQRDELLDAALASAGAEPFRGGADSMADLEEERRPSGPGIQWFAESDTAEPYLGIRQCTGQGDGCNGVVLFTRHSKRPYRWMRTHVPTAVGAEMAALIALAALGQRWP